MSPLHAEAQAILALLDAFPGTKVVEAPREVAGLCRTMADGRRFERG
jgi:hypothetical protein